MLIKFEEKKSIALFDHPVYRQTDIMLPSIMTDLQLIVTYMYTG